MVIGRYWPVIVLPGAGGLAVAAIGAKDVRAQRHVSRHRQHNQRCGRTAGVDATSPKRQVCRDRAALLKRCAVRQRSPWVISLMSTRLVSGALHDALQPALTDDSSGVCCRFTPDLKKPPSDHLPGGGGTALVGGVKSKCWLKSL